MNEKRNELDDPNLLGKAIFRAIESTAQPTERNPNLARELSQEIRGVPAEITDTGFALALGDLLERYRDEPETLYAVLTVAWQFVHIAGLRQFGNQSRAVLAAALAARGWLSGYLSGPGAKRSPVRAAALLLSRALGSPPDARMLELETGLQRYHSAQWLELVRRELTPGAVLDAYEAAIRSERYTSSDLFRQLPGLIAQFDLTTVAKIVGYMFVHLKSRGAKHVEFVHDLELIEPRGWAAQIQTWENQSSWASVLARWIPLNLFRDPFSKKQTEEEPDFQRPSEMTEQQAEAYLDEVMERDEADRSDDPELVP